MRGSSSSLVPLFGLFALGLTASGCGEGGSIEGAPHDNTSVGDVSPEGGAGGTGEAEDLGGAGETSDGGATGGSAGDDSGLGGGGDGGTGGNHNGGSAGVGGTPEVPLESLCTATPDHADCPFQSIKFGSQRRQVVWQIPNGNPPAEGWPVVLLFHGSIFGAETSFSGDEGEAFSPYNGAMNVKALLDSGYAIIAPQGDGLAGAWDTNFPPYSTSWTLSNDHALMVELFEAADAGEFGALDASRWYAMGISSGGYMTSRVAIEYPGRFAAIAINAGSYMTCTNVLCLVPEQDSGHPPTLFLHGQLDPAVPVATMKSYDRKLNEAGVETKVIIDPDVFHAWLAEGQVEIPRWFDTHR